MNNFLYSFTATFMTTIKNINFINCRVQILGTAIFYNDSHNIIKFPSCIIHISGTDKEGNVYFYVTNPYTDVSGFDKDFPGQLQFYNKEYNFYINLTGTATIMSDINLSDENAKSLLKLRITKAKYHNCKRNSKIKNNITDVVATNVNGFFHKLNPFAKFLIQGH